MVGETLWAALEDLAEAGLDWLVAHSSAEYYTPPGWDNYRLPKAEALAEPMGGRCRKPSKNQRDLRPQAAHEALLARRAEEAFRQD